MTETLKNVTQHSVELRKQWLEEAHLTEEHVLHLPENILNYPFSSINITEGYKAKTIYITFRLSYGDDEEAIGKRLDEASIIMSMFAKIGTEWERDATVNSFDGRFKLSGKLVIEDITYKIEIANMDTPPTCKLIEKRKRRTVTIYESECQENELAQANKEK